MQPAKSRELEAEAAQEKAEQAILEENTRWTSQRAQLESQVQDANLTIAKAEKEQQLEMQQQWVKSPVAGLVSDIRVVGVTTKGVDLEVRVLESVSIRSETK